MNRQVVGCAKLNQFNCFWKSHGDAFLQCFPITLRVTVNPLALPFSAVDSQVIEAPSIVLLQLDKLQSFHLQLA
jgi:hypothetical protein